MNILVTIIIIDIIVNIIIIVRMEREAQLAKKIQERKEKANQKQ